LPCGIFTYILKNAPYRDNASKFYMPKILITEDDAAVGQMLEKLSIKRNYGGQRCFNALDAKIKFKEDTVDMVLTDLRLPNYGGIQLLSELKEMSPEVPVIVMTGYAEVSTAVKAMKKGAYDYISKPFTPDEIVMLIENSLDQKESRPHAISPTRKGKGPTTVSKPSMITGISEASKKLQEYIKLVAPTNMSILITGESGTGKEV